MTELQIIEGCLKQNPICQRMLFEQNAGKLMTVCRRYALDDMEAEDMLQEGFMRIFAGLNKFKFQGSFQGWMRRIVVNVALKKFETRKIHFQEIKEEQTGQQVLDSYVYSSLGEEDLLKLINRLPGGYKEIFNLNVIDGYSHEEIGKMLGIQASTSRSQLTKARQLLQEKIAKLYKIAV